MKKQTSDLTKELPIDYKPSVALTNYLELCSEPKLADPYMQKITQEDYLWLEVIYKEYLKENIISQKDIDELGIDRIAEKTLNIGGAKFPSPESNDLEKEIFLEVVLSDPYEYILNKDPTLGTISKEYLPINVLNRLAEDYANSENYDSADFCDQTSDRLNEELKNKYKLRYDIIEVWDKTNNYLKNNPSELSKLKKNYSDRVQQRIKEKAAWGKYYSLAKGSPMQKTLGAAVAAISDGYSTESVKQMIIEYASSRATKENREVLMERTDLIINKAIYQSSQSKNSDKTPQIATKLQKEPTLELNEELS